MRKPRASRKRRLHVQSTGHYIISGSKDLPDYPASFERAKNEAADTLESEAVRRAHDGVFEPTVYQGAFTFPWIEHIDEEGEVTEQVSETPVGTYKHSDALLMFLLKGFRPDKYRENFKVEHSGSVNLIDRLNAGRDRLKKNADLHPADSSAG